MTVEQTVQEEFSDLGLIDESNASEITPEVAERMLLRNTRNRQIHTPTAEKYADAMKRGEWVYNGRAIVFSKEGVLLDGQHTLMGVTISGVTIKCLVAVGLDHETQNTMDTGRSRTFADVLHLLGVKNSAQIAQTVRSVYAWETTGVTTVRNARNKATNQQLLDCYKRNPEIADANSRMAQKDLRMAFYPWLQAAPLRYIFELHDKEDALVFFERLASGTGLEQHDPIFQLREKLIKEQGSDRPMTGYERQALTIRAFNAWRLGDHSLNTRFKMGGANPDNFPEIVRQLGEKPYRMLKNNNEQLAAPA